jgi:hypothetical protein
VAGGARHSPWNLRPGQPGARSFSHRQQIGAAADGLSRLFNTLRNPANGLENADEEDVGPISSITNLASSYLQSILNTTTAKSSSSSGTSSVTAQSENGQLSPFAQLMSTLQQLQQSNPAEYQQVTQQIATNLKTAAQTATADGNSTQASQLTQLATDFSNASQSSQLPNMQDLAQAIGGGHHHHHHGHAASSNADSSSSTNSASTSSADSSSSISPLLAAFQANSAQNEATNPMAIIMNTLSGAGINISSSG